MAFSWDHTFRCSQLYFYKLGENETSSVKDVLALVHVESPNTDAEYPITGKNKTMEGLQNKKMKHKN